MDNNMPSFGDRLKELIADRNIDAERVSHDTGFSRNEIYHWWQDKYRPSLINLIVLADYFRVTLDYILGIDNDSRSNTFKKCPPFGEHFAFVIESLNTNIHRLAKISGVDRNTIYSWLSGKRMPQSDSLIKISTALDVSIDYLVGRES